MLPPRCAAPDVARKELPSVWTFQRPFSLRAVGNLCQPHSHPARKSHSPSELRSAPLEMRLERNVGVREADPPVIRYWTAVCVKRSSLHGSGCSVLKHTHTKKAACHGVHSPVPCSSSVILLAVPSLLCSTLLCVPGGCLLIHLFLVVAFHNCFCRPRRTRLDLHRNLWIPPTTSFSTEISAH